MFNIVSKIFTKNTPVTSREMLEKAINEIISPALVNKALGFFDNPESFIKYLDENNLDIEIDVSEKERDEKKLAYEIFQNILNIEGYVGYIDWADGVDIIIEEFEKLFIKTSLPSFTNEVKEMYRNKTEDCSRGETFMALYDDLMKAVTSRNMELYYLEGGDMHLPIIMKPGTYDKWRRIKFDKNLYVLP